MLYTGTLCMVGFHCIATAVLGVDGVVVMSCLVL